MKIETFSKLLRLQRYLLLGLTLSSALVNADSTSTLVVAITPQKAIDDGAKWRYVVNGQPSQWYVSGHKVTGLDDGELVIEASQPQDNSCIAPSKEFLEIRPGRPHIRELPYICK